MDVSLDAEVHVGPPHTYTIDFRLTLITPKAVWEGFPLCLNTDPSCGAALDRSEFEALRDIPDKLIEEDIRFSKKKNLGPLQTAEDIRISNALGYDLRLTIKYNAETGSKNFNVHISGVGPICRLDVDDQAHYPAGRSHKHSLQRPDCPDLNLPTVEDRSGESGKSIDVLFRRFCSMAKITHTGQFNLPDIAGGGA